MPDQLVPVRDRVSFAKLDEVLPLPDLVGIQRESFDWLLNEGLKEVLEEVSPIEDFTEQFQLYFGKHAVQGRQGHRRGVPRQGHHLQPAVVRRGHLRQQGDRRDQGAGSLHGGLPDHDRAGHLHHQRHRACRGVPARALARRLLLPRARQDHRQGGLHREDHPQPRRVARVRRGQEGHGRRPHRPQAPPARSPCC